MNKEHSKIHCKVCGELKIRIERGKYPGSKNKRYVDEQDRAFNGKTCPDCHAKQAKENMRKHRFVQHLDEKENDKEKN